MTLMTPKTIARRAKRFAAAAAVLAALVQLARRPRTHPGRSRSTARRCSRS